MRGIDRELARKNPFSGYYWGSKILVIFLFSLSLVFSNLLILKLFGLPTALIIKSTLLSPVLIIYELIIGGTSAILGWGHTNPYIFSNAIAEITFTLAGIIAPYQKFPPFFKGLTYTLPYARTMNVFFDSTVTVSLLMDTIIALIWLMIGVACYRYKIQRIGKFQREPML